MTSIEQLIGDLLLRHNCVIVPEFGGFVAKQVSARVDFDSGRMSPPRKSLLFNKQLINNDGLLINELSRLNEISYDEAVLAVHEKVALWNKILKNGERIELDRIGYLFFDAEKNLCFEQDRFFNLLLESFGLGQVHFLTEEDVKIAEHVAIKKEAELAVKAEEPVKVKTKAPIVALINEEEKQQDQTLVEEQVPMPTHRTKRKVWRYVAAACILPIAFYSVWIPMKTDVLESGIISLNDFNPFHQRTEGLYEKESLADFSQDEQERSSLQEQVEDLSADVEVYNYSFKDDVTIPVQLNESSVEDLDAQTEEENDVAPESFNANAMHYVVGCFGDESNAVNLVAKLKASGLNASIVDFHNGLHRVSAGSSISIEGLAEIKVAAENLGFSGWTLK